MRWLLILSVILLAACSNPLAVKSGSSVSQPISQPAMAAYSLHDYNGDMMMQLLQNAGPIPADATIAVGTFTLADTLRSASNDSDAQQLGLQLQESSITLLAQSGFRVLEHRLMDQIVLAEHADYMLSREHERLNQSIRVDYILTGTILPQQHAYAVNTRLIHARNQQVVAAASREIPANIFWAKEKVRLKNGQLYRTEH